MRVGSVSVVERLIKFMKTSKVEHIHELCEDKHSGTLQELYDMKTSVVAL